MIAQLLRLFALRPLLTLALFGIPIFALVVVGLVTVFAVKFLFFIVLPIALLIWVVRKLMRGSGESGPA